MHVSDGVHLNDLGQMAMAFAILKGLDAPADVSAATIDAGQASVVDNENCRVSNVKRAQDGLTFIRLDERLPFNFGLLWTLNEFYIPFGDDLNRYMLTVLRLPEGQYEVSAGGRALGKWSADGLAQGINIASASADPWQPGGPWEAQASALKVYTESRNNLASTRHEIGETLAANPHLGSLRHKSTSIEDALLDLQRATVQPVPVNFVIRAVATQPGAAPTNTAAFPECPLPAGVPNLDEMAGDWKNRGDLEQFSSIHNFDAELLVNKDFASVSWIASPPFSPGDLTVAFSC